MRSGTAKMVRMGSWEPRWTGTEFGGVKMRRSGSVDTHLYHASVWAIWKAAMPAYMGVDDQVFDSRA